jgi:hypothetical protein
MKRDNFRRRPATPRARFVRERDCVRRKIFIIRRTSRLAETNSPGKIVQRILMFDDHPDSLRLILAPPANPQTYSDLKNRDILWDFILPGIVILVGVIAMLWLLL